MLITCIQLPLAFASWRNPDQPFPGQEGAASEYEQNPVGVCQRFGGRAYASESWGQRRSMLKS